MAEILYKLIFTKNGRELIIENVPERSVTAFIDVYVGQGYVFVAKVKM